MPHLRFYPSAPIGLLDIPHPSTKTSRPLADASSGRFLRVLWTGGSFVEGPRFGDNAAKLAPPPRHILLRMSLLRCRTDPANNLGTARRLSADQLSRRHVEGPLNPTSATIGGFAGATEEINNATSLARLLVRAVGTRDVACGSTTSLRSAAPNSPRRICSSFNEPSTSS
jgi:hypothetical protein